MKSDAGEGESASNSSKQPAGAAGETKQTFDWIGAVPEGVVCPACWGELRGEALNGAKMLVCRACGRKYPVVDGIPVLIVERAELGR
jgi:uncharacterized protein YbaR (Trm112 family)